VFTAIRQPLHRAVWIAFLAIFGLVFAPTISHALAHGGGSAWTEVCTLQGMKLVATVDAADQSSQPATSLDHMTHCPLCGLSASPYTPPAAAHSVIEPTGLSHLQPTLFLRASRPLFAWASAQPRAPPAFA